MAYMNGNFVCIADLGVEITVKRALRSACGINQAKAGTKAVFKMSQAQKISAFFEFSAYLVLLYFWSIPQNA